MTKDEEAKVFAIKYELDYNTFSRSERFRSDLLMIQRRYFGSGDEEFERLTDKYINDLRFRKMMPLWARQIMAERYSLVV